MEMMLDDVKIIDFTTNVAGPGASAMASDFGANVIKIESQSGDSARTYAPFMDGKGMTHAWVNRGKKSVVMNLKDPRAIEVCKKLIKDADILVEGFRPGVMERLGLGYEAMKEINPKLIYCSVSAFGQTGPYAQRPGFDLLGQAISGMISVNGEKGGHPIKHGVTIADYFAGPNAYAAIMTALHYQRRTGKGQHIDVSLIQGMIYLNSTIDRLNDGVIVKPPQRALPLRRLLERQGRRRHNLRPQPEGLGLRRQGHGPSRLPHRPQVRHGQRPRQVSGGDNRRNRGLAEHLPQHGCRH